MLGDAWGARTARKTTRAEYMLYRWLSAVLRFGRSWFCFLYVLVLLAKVKSYLHASRRRGSPWGAVAAWSLPFLLLSLTAATSWAGNVLEVRLLSLPPTWLDWITAMISWQGNSSLPSSLPLTGLFRGMIFFFSPGLSSHLSTCR